MKKTINLKEKPQALATISEEIAHCKVCKAGKIGLPVPGEGNPDADIVFIGEAPGKKEAETGQPFIGRSGKFLRQLMGEVGIDPAEVFITSPVKYLPKYTTPRPKDIAHGIIHLSKQLEIIDPQVIVLLGNTAALALLGQKFSFVRDHGKVIQQGKKTYFLSYHPAAALYLPRLRPIMKKDFLKLKKLISKQ
jgi:uracil-DNA glycosylase